MNSEKGEMPEEKRNQSLEINENDTNNKTIPIYCNFKETEVVREALNQSQEKRSQNQEGEELENEKISEKILNKIDLEESKEGDNLEPNLVELNLQEAKMVRGALVFQFEELGESIERLEQQRDKSDDPQEKVELKRKILGLKEKIEKNEQVRGRMVVRASESETITGVYLEQAEINAEKGGKNEYVEIHKKIDGNKKEEKLHDELVDQIVGLRKIISGEYDDLYNEESKKENDIAEKRDDILNYLDSQKEKGRLGNDKYEELKESIEPISISSTVECDDLLSKLDEKSEGVWKEGSTLNEERERIKKELMRKAEERILGVEKKEILTAEKEQEVQQKQEKIIEEIRLSEDNPKRIKDLENKLREYHERLKIAKEEGNDFIYKNTFHKIAVLQILLNSKEVNIPTLKREMEKGSDYNLSHFNNAIFVIKNYAEARGEGVMGGTGFGEKLQAENKIFKVEKNQIGQEQRQGFDKKEFEEELRKLGKELSEDQKLYLLDIFNQAEKDREEAIEVGRKNIQEETELTDRDILDYGKVLIKLQKGESPSEDEIEKVNKILSATREMKKRRESEPENTMTSTEVLPDEEKINSKSKEKEELSEEKKLFLLGVLKQVIQDMTKATIEVKDINIIGEREEARRKKIQQKIGVDSNEIADYEVDLIRIKISEGKESLSEDEIEKVNKILFARKKIKEKERLEERNVASQVANVVFSSTKSEEPVPSLKTTSGTEIRIAGEGEGVAEGERETLEQLEQLEKVRGVMGETRRDFLIETYKKLSDEDLPIGISKQERDEEIIKQINGDEALMMRLLFEKDRDVFTFNVISEKLKRVENLNGLERDEKRLFLYLFNQESARLKQELRVGNFSSKKEKEEFELKIKEVEEAQQAMAESIFGKSEFKEKSSERIRMCREIDGIAEGEELPSEAREETMQLLFEDISNVNELEAKMIKGKIKASQMAEWTVSALTSTSTEEREGILKSVAEYGVNPDELNDITSMLEEKLKGIRDPLKQREIIEKELMKGPGRKFLDSIFEYKEDAKNIAWFAIIIFNALINKIVHLLEAATKGVTIPGLKKKN